MMQRIIYSLLILMMMAHPVWADSGSAGEALPVLRFGVGARAFALGGAFGVVADDATAVYWNASGLAGIEQSNFSAMHSELFLGTTYDYLGWATPVGQGGLGINLLRLSTPGILLVDDGVVTGNSDASVEVIYIGYGREVKGWQFGVTGKLIRQELPTATGDAWGLDLGFQKQINDHYRIGFTVQDILSSKVEWDTGHSEDIPANYRLGLAYRQDRILLILEHETTGDFSESHFGLEYSAAEFLKIRSGMRGSDFTAGIGITKDHYQIDYAYCGGDLGNTHRLSFGLNF